VTLLHIATAPRVRRTGVGSRLLAELWRRVPPELPIAAETDHDAVAFYAANGFVVTSLGEKYPGVERFRVRLEANPASRR
jgi:ribosomal protein S18 acetylase RimI-like enzyme